MCVLIGAKFLQICIFAFLQIPTFTSLLIILTITIVIFYLYSILANPEKHKCKNAKMQKSERRVTGLREKVLRIHSTCARVKVKTIQLFPGKDNNSERYRALSCVIVPYRAISDIAQKKCCIFAPQMRQKLQYPAIPCIAQNKCCTFAPELRRGLTQRNRARSADELRSMTLARVLAAPRQSSSKLGSALGLHNTCHCDINVDGGST